MAQLIDGKVISAKVRKEVGEGVKRLQAAKGITPGLAVIRVGEDPASKVYVNGKRKDAEEVGFNAWEFHYDEKATQAQVLAKVAELNADKAVHGVLVQLPLPKGLDADAIISAVRPEKDADGFHPLNAGNLFLGRPGIRPCTPYGVMRMLEEIGFSPEGKKAVVVGRSNIVGKPMAMMLLQANATVTVCHRKSNLQREVADADLLVVAVGVAELIKGEWIKPGAVVVDVGMNRSAEGKLVGDVHFKSASERASFITPVPGGVGLMTRAMLLQNTLNAAALSVGVSAKE
jgi:methylenetetrahydrofolate dehydrogenase (NADP+)/methenyltetrahydrofolate cyclohydrolase